MDIISFIELCSALVTVATPIGVQMLDLAKKHIALDAKIEALATELETHKADLTAIQTELQAIRSAVQ